MQKYTIRIQKKKKQYCIYILLYTYGEEMLELEATTSFNFHNFAHSEPVQSNYIYIIYLYVVFIYPYPYPYKHLSYE